MSVISTSYQQRQFTVLQASQDQIDLWERFPVKLSEAEEKTLNMDLVIPVMEGARNSPSERAGIPDTQIVSNTIHMLDRVYQRAMSDYIKNLREAVIKDKNSVVVNQKFWRCEYYYYGFWWVLRIIGSPFINQDRFDRNVQAQRYAWLIEVNVLEKKRLDAIKDHIIAALDPLIQHLEELEKKNQIDIQAAKKAWQLKKVYDAHFPKTPLAQDGVLTQLLHLDRFNLLLNS